MKEIVLDKACFKFFNELNINFIILLTKNIRFTAELRKIKIASLQKLLLVFYYIVFLLIGVLFGVPVTLIYTARGIFWQWKNSGLIYGFKEVAITFRLNQSIDRKRSSASQVTLVKKNPENINEHRLTRKMNSKILKEK